MNSDMNSATNSATNRAINSSMSSAAITHASICSHQFIHFLTLSLLATLLLWTGLTSAQEAAYDYEVTDVEPAEEALLTAEALQALVAPVALYPDDLLAVVLPASTFPLQVVQASRYLENHEQNNQLNPEDDWDESIVALLNYPEALQLLNEDLDWTWQLGEAVLNQHADVIAAITAFRTLAHAAGNLETDDYQTVAVQDDGVIEIRPADPEVIYVPYYEPSRVIIYSRTPVYHYYSHAYPLYYYPYPAGYRFHTRFFWGVTSAFTIGWHTRHLHVHHLDYDDHPYYGYRYHHTTYYYRQPLISVNYYNYHNDYNKHKRYTSGRYDKRRKHHEGNRWHPPRDTVRPRLRSVEQNTHRQEVRRERTIANYREDLLRAKQYQRREQSGIRPGKAERLQRGEPNLSLQNTQTNRAPTNRTPVNREPISRDRGIVEKVRSQKPSISHAPGSRKQFSQKEEPQIKQRQATLPDSPGKERRREKESARPVVLPRSQKHSAPKPQLARVEARPQKDTPSAVAPSPKINERREKTDKKEERKGRQKIR